MDSLANQTFQQASQKVGSQTLAPQSRSILLCSSNWQASAIRYYNNSTRNLTNLKLLVLRGTLSTTHWKERQELIAYPLLRSLKRYTRALSSWNLIAVSNSSTTTNGIRTSLIIPCSRLSMAIVNKWTWVHLQSKESIDTITCSFPWAKRKSLQMQALIQIFCCCHDSWWKTS